MNWIDVNECIPLSITNPADWYRKPSFYVLAVDIKDRMSVGYRIHDGRWIFAKPIGEPTHWMPLPKPPVRIGDTDGTD